MRRPITPRQREILVGLWNGETQKGVAVRLGLSRHTVDAHLMAMRLNLEAHTTCELMKRGVELGILRS